MYVLHPHVVAHLSGVPVAHKGHGSRAVRDTRGTSAGILGLCPRACGRSRRGARRRERRMRRRTYAPRSAMDSKKSFPSRFTESTGAVNTRYSRSRCRSDDHNERVSPRGRTRPRGTRGIIIMESLEFSSQRTGPTVLHSALPKYRNQRTRQRPALREKRPLRRNGSPLEPPLEPQRVHRSERLPSFRRDLREPRAMSTKFFAEPLRKKKNGNVQLQRHTSRSVCS